MMHDVEYVARSHNLPEADLVDFAIARDNKYNIEMVNGIARVGTWFVGALIADFQDFQAEELQLKGYCSCTQCCDAQIMEMAEAMKPFDAGCEYD